MNALELYIGFISLYFAVSSVNGSSICRRYEVELLRNYSRTSVPVKVIVCFMNWEYC